MNIAFIDHLPLGSGITRMATMLAKSLLETDKDTTITFYTHWGTYQRNRELYQIDSPKFKLRLLKSSYPRQKIYHYSDRILNLTGIKTKDKLQGELKQIKGFDAVYFTAAHMSPYYHVDGVKFATFHDFNWKYVFGTPIFSKSDVQVFNNAMPEWFANTVPIVSSHFILGEIEKFYPEHKYPVEVIYLPNIGKEVKETNKRTVEFPYILYPANLYAHKNHMMLFQGLYLLKQQGKLNGVKLVLTGACTDHFKYAKLSPVGLEESNSADFDVLGLGYVSNDEMDSLIKHALLNISASVYEAGSGPAIDAWINKAPFMMSAIEPHKNQLRHFDLDCILFNPFNPDDIADKIGFALQNPDKMMMMSQKGHDALKKNNWEIASRNYLNIFRKYANGN